MKSKKLLVISILILLCFLVGCVDREFDSNYQKFKESYILATDFVEKGNDPLKALKSMDINVVEAELSKMKKVMNKMSTKLNAKTEELIYGNVERDYKGVEFLLEAAKDFENLSIEEKQMVYVEAELASMNRKRIKQGEI